MGNVCNFCLKDSSVFVASGELETVSTQKKDIMNSIIIIQRAWRRHSLPKSPSLYSTQETS